MNREAPTQLDQIGLPPHTFKYSDERSWRGPCPVCGGHRRFVIFTDHEWPMWFGYCDQCGHQIKAWTKVITQISDEQRENAHKRAEQIDRQRFEDRQRKLAQFSASELWEAYRRKMSAEHRAQWESWGVPEEWQDYLELGYTPDKKYRDESGEIRHSAAYTIPYMHYTADKPQFKTMQYRLFNASNPNDRYRFEHGLPATYYMTTPTEPIADEVIICEGAKKGIVVRINVSEITVLAVPAKGSWGGVVDAVKQCGRVHVCLDPDATDKAVKMAQQIGKQARVIHLPVKADDFFTLYGGTQSDFIAAVKAGMKL